MNPSKVREIAAKCVDPRSDAELLAGYRLRHEIFRKNMSKGQCPMCAGSENGYLPDYRCPLCRGRVIGKEGVEILSLVEKLLGEGTHAAVEHQAMTPFSQVVKHRDEARMMKARKAKS